MLSIKDFSEMAHLSAQTLRYYHAEGLLIPAQVDEQTGYRSYTFDQIEQAMLITVLRQANLGVKQVKQALDEPDMALALLHEHSAYMQRQRAEQDEALLTARELLMAQPEPRRRHVSAMTVASKSAPVTPLGRDRQEWDLTEEILTAATEDLITTVQRCGAAPAGPPWRVLDTKNAAAGTGAFWLVQVAVVDDASALAALPPDIEVRQRQAGEEVSIVMPGRTSMAKYCTATGRLLAHPIDDAFLDIALLRHVVSENSVEFSVPIRSVP